MILKPILYSWKRYDESEWFKLLDVRKRKQDSKIIAGTGSWVHWTVIIQSTSWFDIVGFLNDAYRKTGCRILLKNAFSSLNKGGWGLWYMIFIWSIDGNIHTHARGKIQVWNGWRNRKWNWSNFCLFSLIGWCKRSWEPGLCKLLLLFPFLSNLTESTAPESWVFDQPKLVFYDLGLFLHIFIYSVAFFRLSRAWLEYMTAMLLLNLDERLKYKPRSYPEFQWLREAGSKRMNPFHNEKCSISTQDLLIAKVLSVAAFMEKI